MNGIMTLNDRDLLEQLEREERIARCQRYAEQCRIASGDESLTLKERYFATMGEVDWTVAEHMEREAA